MCQSTSAVVMICAPLLDLSSVVFPGESSLCSSMLCGSDYSSTQFAFQVPLDNASNHSLPAVPFRIELACWWAQILLTVAVLS